MSILQDVAATGSNVELEHAPKHAPNFGVPMPWSRRERRSHWAIMTHRTTHFISTFQIGNWRYNRGISLAPLYKGAPKAALQDPKFYSVLSLCDAIRSGRARERNLAVELWKKR
jgi:hypothetical protein